MPRHLISDAHEWINEIPTVPIYHLAKPQPRERAWQNQRGKKTLLSLTHKQECMQQVPNTMCDSPTSTPSTPTKKRKNIDISSSLKPSPVRTAEKTILKVPSEILKNCWSRTIGIKVKRKTEYHITSHPQAVAVTWKKLSDFPDICVFCDYACGGSGYPEMKISTEYKIAGVRVIVLRLFRPETLPTPTHDASHFACNNKLCINPKHLMWEEHDVNVSRFCCKSYVTKFQDYRCPHIPTCTGCKPCVVPL